MNFPIVYFDIETQELINTRKRAIDQMRMSVGVVMSDTDYFIFHEGQVQQLMQMLWGSGLVVGFNVMEFDYVVLSGYTAEWEAAKLRAGAGTGQARPRTFDLFEDIKRQTKVWPSLSSLGIQTLGMEKCWDGMNAVEFWWQHKLDEVITHCKQDVELLRQLYQKYVTRREALRFISNRNKKLYEVTYKGT